MRKIRLYMLRFVRGSIKKQISGNTVWFAIILCLILLWGSAGLLAETQQSEEETIAHVILDHEWSYHWGDFDLDEQGKLLGIENKTNWIPYLDNAVLSKDAHTFLWLKRTLTNISIANPAMFIAPFRMHQSFEVYLDQTLIYRAGQLGPGFTNRHLFFRWHLIPLPANCAGKTLLFRFYSDHPTYIGLMGNIYLGERNRLFDQFILKDLGLTVFGLIFIFAGLFSYGVFIKIYAQKNIPVFAFATMATFSGIYLLADASYISQLFVAQPDILFYGWHISFFLFMAGIYAFFESTIGIGRKWVYRLFWQFQVICLLLFILCDMLYIVTVNTYLLSIIGASLGILVGGVDTIKRLRQGDREVRILGLGFSVFGVTGLVSMWSDRYLAISNWKAYPYGLLFLLVSLAYLLILRYQMERTRSEELLRRSEERLAGIVGALTDAITMIDAQGLVVWANDVAKVLFGSDLVNRNYHDAFQYQKNNDDISTIYACLQDGKPREEERGLTMTDGNQKDFWCTTSVAARHKDGQPSMVIQVLRDITAKKTLQAEAARSAHLASLGELSAGVAHEINNPISGIIGCTEILAEECVEQGVSTEIPDRILKEGKRIARIIGNLLSFARDQKRVLSPTQIRDVLEDALVLTAKLFQQNGIRIHLDLAQDLPLIMADGQQIQQVFINLLNNARYALDHRSPEKLEEKVLAIACQLVDINACQYIRTLFHDNGMGIPDNVLDKVCDPFFSTKPRGEGTGLGLSISYGIIKDHDGYLSFDSQEGAYTKVMVDLPVLTI